MIKAGVVTRAMIFIHQEDDPKSGLMCFVVWQKCQQMKLQCIKASMSRRGAQPAACLTPWSHGREKMTATTRSSTHT